MYKHPLNYSTEELEWIIVAGIRKALSPLVFLVFLAMAFLIVF